MSEILYSKTRSELGLKAHKKCRKNRSRKLKVAVNTLAFVMNASIIAGGIGLAVQNNTAHANLGLFKHDLTILQAMTVGDKSTHELRGVRKNSYTHLGSLKIYNSSINNLKNVGSTRIYEQNKIDSFGLIGSVKIYESELGSGWTVGSTEITNSAIKAIEIKADTITINNSVISTDVVISNPKNGHDSVVNINGSHIGGRLICNSHCVINKTNYSEIDAGIVN